jgi:hypothetical protein
MKKLSPEQRLRFIRTAAKRARKKNKRRRRTAHRCELPGHTTITAPAVFTILDGKHRNRVTDFLSLLRNTVMKKNESVLIDFVNTRKMFADGTLLLRAELCRLQKIKPVGVHITCGPPKNKKVSEVLHQTKIYKTLNYRAHKSIDFDDVVHWTYADGTGADGEKYDEILGRYDGTISPTLAEGLYLGLTEAMTNCHHHAYLSARNDGLGILDSDKDWWMFSQERDGWLSVVFCDLGIGIPGSLPMTRPSIWSLITKLGNANDGVVIEEAIKASRSRTGKSYRGKGLKQLVDTIDRFPAGQISIHSNRGWYTYDKSKKSTQTKAFSRSILGTLIAWRVPLPTNAEQMHENSRNQDRARIF